MIIADEKHCCCPSKNKTLIISSTSMDHGVRGEREVGAASKRERINKVRRGIVNWKKAKS